MEEQRCANNCNVPYLSQLYICTESSCFAPAIRCRNCFRFFHSSADETGHKKIHSHLKFDESPTFKNFYYLIKILEITIKKAKKVFGQFSSNSEYLGFVAFSSSEAIRKIFDTPALLQQFYVFKELYYRRPAQFTSSPSAEFVTALCLFTEKSYKAAKATLTRNSPQYDLMNYSFNQITNNNSLQFQSFVQEEQRVFIQYCELLQEKKEQFSIFEYLEIRRKQANKNENYYCRDFENFLEEKYAEHPEKSAIFEMPEYSRYVWSTLPNHINNSNYIDYFNDWCSSYAFYSEHLKGQQIEESLLSFRMWRENSSKNLQHSHSPLKNKYFLDTFITTYISYLIYRNEYGIGENPAKTWQSFIIYLKDYVSLTESKNEDFVNLAEYQDYFEFRNEYEGSFVNHVKNSKDIVYNKKYIVEYINRTYQEGVTISLKNYKKYVTSKEEEKNERIEELKKISEKLRSTLEEEEGSKFYLTLFQGYITNAIEYGLEITKEDYYLYREEILKRFDEEEIKLENQLLAMEMKELEGEVLEGKKQQSEVLPAITKQENVSYSIDIAEDWMKQVQDQQDDEEEGEKQEFVCLCCHGDSENCSQPECEMMGYCVTCSL